jgi:hypothetical protein
MIELSSVLLMQVSNSLGLFSRTSILPEDMNVIPLISAFAESFVTFVSKSNTKLPPRTQFLETVISQSVQSPAELMLD